MKKRSWIELIISLPASYQELLTGPLVQLGFEGFVQEDASFIAYIERHKFSMRLRQQLQEAIESFRSALNLVDVPFSTKRIDEENWNKRWEQQTGIVDVTRRIIIKPTWKKLRKKDKGKIVLHIDPKMSFGTGHHETTRLSIALLEKYLIEKSTVLDFGTGTGVLAIAAVKLGAGRVIAIDNDPWSVENAEENVARNRVERSLKVLKGSVSKIPKRKFDLIIANIDIPTISKYVQVLSRRLNPSAFLILSGLLLTDLDQLLLLLHERRLVPLEVVNENEWVAIALVKA